LLLENVKSSTRIDRRSPHCFVSRYLKYRAFN
jgi:hypothetical protein